MDTLTKKVKLDKDEDDKNATLSEHTAPVLAAEYCLTNFAIIVERIFGFLNAKQLCVVSLVCKVWRELARKEKLKRIDIESKMVYIEDDDEDGTEDSKKMMMEIQNALIEKIQNARCYPAVAILYINRSERFYGVAEENAAVRQMIKRLQKTLPPNTPLIGSLAGGVIGCNENLQVEEVEQTESASLLLLPSSPSLQVHPFFIKLTDVRSAGLLSSEWEKLIGCPKTLSPKVALLHACCDTNEVHDAVTMLSRLFGDDVPIAGGIAEYLVDNNKLKSKGIAGVLLGGNLSATLRVSVGPDMNDLYENLTQMKADYGAMPNSLMLMYCCVARGQQLYEKPNAETNCVREVFGKIPMFGFFAFGEVGKAGDGPVEHGRRRSGLGSHVHSFSTVSCYCSFE